MGFDSTSNPALTESRQTCRIRRAHLLSSIHTTWLHGCTATELMLWLFLQSLGHKATQARYSAIHPALHLDRVGSQWRVSVLEGFKAHQGSPSYGMLLVLREADPSKTCWVVRSIRDHCCKDRSGATASRCLQHRRCFLVLWVHAQESKSPTLWCGWGVALAQLSQGSTHYGEPNLAQPAKRHHN